MKEEVVKDVYYHKRKVKFGFFLYEKNTKSHGKEEKEVEEDEEEEEEEEEKSGR